MCEALRKLMEDDFIATEARGVAIGEARGESKLASLMDKLFSLDRFDDAQRAAKDERYRAELFKEFQIL